MTNLYKVWIDGNGYMLEYAENESEAKVQYASDYTSMSDDEILEEMEMGNIGCRLVYEGIDAARGGNEDDEIMCVKMLDMDLLLASVIHPSWAEMRMVDGWWWEDWIPYVRD